MTKRKERPVRNNPGIAKQYKLIGDGPDQKWVETGRYRAIRRVLDDTGHSRKEQKICWSLEEAKAFRRGGTQEVPEVIDETVTAEPEKPYTFQDLVNEWMPFHYLKLEKSTQQTYDKRLPGLDFLKDMPVESITTSVVDKLVQFWVHKYPKKGSRENFEKELNLLKVILNYYRKRKNPAYVIPVFLEHYHAADIAKKAQAPVESLSQDELIQFLDALKASRYRYYYPVALAQYCLGLRIGEVCGLHWDAIDLQKKVIRIEWTIIWDHLTWEPTIKERPKNNKVRVLVIPEVLAQELTTLPRSKETPLLFWRHGKPLNRQLVAKAYNATLEKLGIRNVRGTHMLRKTAATLANEITGDFHAVSRLLDHSNPSVTMRYVSQTGSQKQKVAEALNSVLMRQPKETQPPQNASPTTPPVPQVEDRPNRPRLSLVYSR